MQFHKNFGLYLQISLHCIIQDHIVNRRHYANRLQSQKEKEELLAKDPDAVIPAKKRGRPVAADSLRKRLKAIREEVGKIRRDALGDEGRKGSESEESDEDDDFQ